MTFRYRGVLLARAARRGGIITIEEARRLGASDKVMGGLVRAGVFRRIHPGVYGLAGSPGGHEADLRAALAALGRSASASHRSAAWLHGLVDQPPARPVLTVFTATRRTLAGVVVHRSSGPVPGARVAGLRCTDAARTLVDLAAEAGPTEVAGAVDRALARRLVTLAGLERSLPPRRRGVGRLRRCLAERGYLGAPAPSVLESRMMRILLELDLPLPRAEVRAGPDGSYRIDFAYPAVRLAIECYGYAWHSSPQQMAHDLYRQRQLSLEGWTVLIYTWTDVVEHPMKVGREIAAVYSRLAAPAPPTAAGRVVAR